MTTFSISVHQYGDTEQASPEDLMDYIIIQIESGNLLRVTNIVRDY